MPGAHGPDPGHHDRPPLERVLELFVFAPVGLAVSAREVVPRLADKGRRHLGGQVRNARAVGELTVRLARRQVRRALGQSPGEPPTEGGPGLSAPRAVPARKPVPDARTPASAGQQVVPGDSAAPAPASPDAAGLAIPGYDSLSASQVVARLAGLDRDELEAVRAYETARRRRASVLARVAQLQAAPKE